MGTEYRRASKKESARGPPNTIKQLASWRIIIKQGSAFVHSIRIAIPLNFFTKSTFLPVLKISFVSSLFLLPFREHRYQAPPCEDEQP